MPIELHFQAIPPILGMVGDLIHEGLDQDQPSATGLQGRRVRGVDLDHGGMDQLQPPGVHTQPFVANRQLEMAVMLDPFDHDGLSGLVAIGVFDRIAHRLDHAEFDAMPRPIRHLELLAQSPQGGANEGQMFSIALDNEGDAIVREVPRHAEQAPVMAFCVGSMRIVLNPGLTATDKGAPLR